MSTDTIMITGAPGNVGTELCTLLLASGSNVRVGARNLEKARSILGTNLEYSPFDFSDASTYANALNGVKRLFLVRPPAIADVKRYISPVIDAAKNAGVGHVVFMSVLGAERNPIVPHHKIENYIMKVRVPYTFLRPTYFMQNLNTTYRTFIKEAGEIPLPVGQGKMSFIDARDIACVAALALTTDKHIGQAYTLTGSEAYNFFEVARILTEVLKRPIRYTDPSFRRYRQIMREAGFPSGIITVTSMMYLLARLGLSATLTTDIENILGRAPITLHQYATDFLRCFE